MKPRNVVLARHILSTRKQKAGENVHQFLNELKTLAKDCDFKTVSVDQYRSEMIRDAFINGLQSNHIRQRLLENKTLNLQTAFDQARSLDVARQSSTMFSQPSIPEKIAPIPKGEFEKSAINDTSLAAVNSNGKQNTQSCWFCGNSRHPRKKCPAKDAAWHKCKKIGHYEKLCRSTNVSAAIPKSAPMHEEDHFLASVPPSKSHFHEDYVLASVPSNKSHFRVKMTTLINNKYKADILIDTGSTDRSFISEKIARLWKLKVSPILLGVGMAAASLSSQSSNYCVVNLTVQNQLYSNVKLHLLKGLCTDKILGTDFQE